MPGVSAVVTRRDEIVFAGLAIWLLSLFDSWYRSCGGLEHFEGGHFNRTCCLTWRGIGICIEDDILVTPEGHENLTAAIPRAPDAIEGISKSDPIDD